MLAWKAKLLGQQSPGLEKLRVEIRKTVIGTDSHAQVVLIVGADGSVMQSMNSRAAWTAQDWRDQIIAVAEALGVLEAYKSQRLYEQITGPVR